MLRLSIEQYNQLRALAKADLPNEICGLLLGKITTIEAIIPIKNIALNAENHYEMDAQELFRAHQRIEREGLELLGIYHSHPRHEAIPSQEDIREAELNTPNLVHLIISLKYPQIGMKAWKIQLGQVDEVELLIGQQRSQKIQPSSKLQAWAIVLATICAVLLLLGISFALLPAAPPILTAP